MALTATKQNILLRDQILEFAEQQPYAYPLCYETLGHLGNKPQLFEVLDQLAEENMVIELVGEEVYFLTYLDPELNGARCAPIITEGIEQLAEIRSETLVLPPCGCANALGLTSQCVNITMYMTDGQARISKFGNLPIRYDKAEEWQLLFPNQYAGMGIGAMHFLRRYNGDKGAGILVKKVLNASDWGQILSVFNQLPSEIQECVLWAEKDASIPVS